MRTKELPIRLTSDLYTLLEERAREEERDPLQQARFMLKRALLGDPSQLAKAGEGSAPESA